MVLFTYGDHSLWIFPGMENGNGNEIFVSLHHHDHEIALIPFLDLCNHDHGDLDFDNHDLLYP